MVNSKKIITAIITAITASVLLSGCGKMVKPNIENGYATQYAVSGVEYTIFLSDQIAVAENALMTRISMADSVAEGTYEASKEIENTDEAISKIESLKTGVTTKMPAQGFETDRETILGQIEDSLIALKDYKEALSAGSKNDIKSCAESMRACYLALSGEANVLYE